ncbi:MAG: alpha-galactosidase [Anaerolineae bacterium]|jgi:alpha-galactosidase
MVNYAIGGGTPIWSETKRAAIVRYRIGERVEVIEIDEPNVARHVEGLRLVWRWQEEDRGYRMWVRATHRGEHPIAIETIDVLAAPIPGTGTPRRAWSVYQNGWQSWSPTFARQPGDGLHTVPGTPDYRRKHQPHWEPPAADTISSQWVTVLATQRPADGAAVLIGFVTAEDQLAEILVRKDRSQVVARCHCDGVRLDPGESLRSETLLVWTGSDALPLLEAWADAMGSEMNARVPRDPPTGWCSWYTFYGENTEQDVVDNVTAIEAHDLPLEVVLIDDGYQTAIGDWFSLDREKFPDGMKAVAEEVHQAGHRAGIWTAPFGAAADSQLLDQHPDWVLRDDADQPVVGWVHWGKTCYALDCTHPEVLDWLRETFNQMRQEWAIDLFKIDFLFAAARPGRRYDPTATRAHALRRGVEVIREAIGAGAFLLGCGAPLGPCVGLVDGMRIGPDVDPNWHPIWRHDLSSVSTKNALRNVVTRAPFHGRLWANDPDCVLVRERGQDMDLVLNEMRTLAALVALSGGLTLDSDDLSQVNPGRLKYLRQTLPPTGISARPLDLFEHEMPRLFVLPVERGWGYWWVAGVINWDDHTVETTVRLADLGLPAGRYHVYHYWRRRYLGVVEDAITVRRHQPHETAVLLFRPVSQRPDLLTTTFHVCQGVAEIADCRVEIADSSTRITVMLQKAGTQFGRLLFTVPKGWRLVEAQVDGRKQAPVTDAPGVVSLGLTLEQQAVVEAAFEKVTG